MLYFILKTLITALVVAGVSELAKRSSSAGAILASLPLTSILAMIWLYRDTESNEQISQLSYGILWAIIPSLLFFIILPLLLKQGMKFGWAMLASCAVMSLAYSGYVLMMRKFGVEL